jgi:hypothetical protein
VRFRNWPPRIERKLQRSKCPGTAAAAPMLMIFSIITSHHSLDSEDFTGTVPAIVFWKRTVRPARKHLWRNVLQVMLAAAFDFGFVNFN